MSLRCFPYLQINTIAAGATACRCRPVQYRTISMVASDEERREDTGVYGG